MLPDCSGWMDSGKYSEIRDSLSDTFHGSKLGMKDIAARSRALLNQLNSNIGSETE